uniref:Uncharacterized protein n=1 Tax=Meloidogyne enterolobii TaxID=390850 RepID=A0A6V7TZ74_MELEN|nr:unnamed protein product [Meloidogyne enterolobii]
MKINFRRYLYIFSIALFLTSILILDFIFSYPYSFGGIKNFDNFNKTLSYIQYANVGTNMSFIPMALSEIFLYLIIIVCGFKMVRFVSLNTNLDGNLKRLNKQLTKVLIILAVVPFIVIAGDFSLMFFRIPNKDVLNIVQILINILYHLVPVFNPIICILTNTPYRNAIFNRSQVHPQ